MLVIWAWDPPGPSQKTIRSWTWEIVSAHSCYRCLAPSSNRATDNGLQKRTEGGPQFTRFDKQGKEWIYLKFDHTRHKTTAPSALGRVLRTRPFVRRDV